MFCFVSLNVVYLFILRKDEKGFFSFYYIREFSWEKLISSLILFFLSMVEVIVILKVNLRKLVHK